MKTGKILNITGAIRFIYTPEIEIQERFFGTRRKIGHKYLMETTIKPIGAVYKVYWRA